VKGAKGLAAAFAAFGLFWGSWAACLPAIQRSTDASEAELGVVLLTVAVAALPAMLAAGSPGRCPPRASGADRPRRLRRCDDAPGLAGSVPALFGCLALVGFASGLLDVAINADAARIEATRNVCVMDGLHASFSAGVLVGGVSSGLLRKAGAHPSWILAGVGTLIVLCAAFNRAPAGRPAGAERRARLAGTS
jgi:hypothetical protein